MCRHSPYLVCLDRNARIAKNNADRVPKIKITGSFSRILLAISSLPFTIHLLAFPPSPSFVFYPFIPVLRSRLPGCHSSHGGKSKSFRLGRSSRTLVLLVPDGNSSASVSIHRCWHRARVLQQEAGRWVPSTCSLSLSLYLFRLPLFFSYSIQLFPTYRLVEPLPSLFSPPPATSCVRLRSFVRSLPTWQLYISSCIDVSVIHSELPTESPFFYHGAAPDVTLSPLSSRISSCSVPTNTLPTHP